MKVLLLIPKRYTLTEMLMENFKKIGWDVVILDDSEILPHLFGVLYNKTVGFPKILIKNWKQYYYRKVNEIYLKNFAQNEPDLVVVYNNQFTLPSTLKEFKKYSKISFILGDNPLYSDTFNYNLEILKYSDYTVCPDSFWRDQLTSIGLKNVFLDFIGYDKNIFFKAINIPKEIFNRFNSDALFIGRAYRGASGFKRAAFYNEIKINNFKIFGNSEWLDSFESFPDLQKKFIVLKENISNSELNFALNSTRVYPIEQNKGIINGIHLRVFESIGAGTLPIVEWRKDVEDLFGANIPTVKNYSELNRKILYYLNNERERTDITKYLKAILDKKYSPFIFVKNIIQHTGLTH